MGQSPKTIKVFFDTFFSKESFGLEECSFDDRAKTFQPKAKNVFSQNLKILKEKLYHRNMFFFKNAPGT